MAATIAGTQNSLPPDSVGAGSSGSGTVARGGAVGLGVCQWKLSPHAHDPVAFGLSMVKPCFSMVSTKSIVAPVR